MSKADSVEERWRSTGNQFSADLISCAAFFMVTSKGVENSGKPEDKKTAEQWQIQAARIFSFAEVVSQKIGQKPEVPGIRIKMMVESMMEEMGGHYMNYSILSSKYMDRCVDLARNPDSALAKRLEEQK
jgi:hypothetical protein